MKLKIEDLEGKHKGQECYVALHGPSLNSKLEEIESRQKEGVLRFSVNEWYDFFESKPDYWVLANSESTIDKYVFGTDKMSSESPTVLFADTVDMTDYRTIEQILNCDYLGYDQRHFKGHKCLDILKNFRQYKNTNDDFNFKEYGNNSIMFEPPRIQSGAGFSVYNRKCCSRIEKRNTIQEELMRISGYNQHYSTGDTVALHAIAFALIMGCNPINIVGMDLDYSGGYAKNKANLSTPNNNDWHYLEKNLINDLTVLRESAKMMNIQINDLSNSRFDIFREKT